MSPSSATSQRSTPRRQPPPRRRLPVIPLAIGVIALLAVVAVVAASLAGDDGDGGGGAGEVREVRAVTATGAPLVLLGDGSDAALGQPAPKLVGARFDGSPLRIEADGRPKVLVFLAHWCPHCQREVPVLADWLDANGVPDDVDVYGVATGTSSDRPNYPPSAWLTREGFTPPTLVDDAEGTAASAFGLSAFPFFVALDTDGRVAARASGELTTAQWEALLARAAASR